MTKSKNKVELLAPAGNFEKLETAIYYGADAVYLAGKDFSLRNYSGNFSPEEMRQAIELAHKNNVKVYVACNIYSRNEEQEKISNYLEQLGKIKPDAIIIADPAVIFLAQKIIPEIDIHLSTQANTTNYNSVLFWEKLGISRINTARELTLPEIAEICKKCNSEIETFVHGAMCISYSGRCLLSGFMIGRDSNRGFCAQSCRWKYSVVEELRPGEYMPVEENSRGTYIFNSRDLCMIEHIPELIEAGISSFKIEGRMKGINYLASVVKVYREAIDDYYDKNEYFVKKEWVKELSIISNRTYCTGFYFNDPEERLPNFSNEKPELLKLFVGKILENPEDGLLKIEVRNKIETGDKIEIITPKGPAQKDRILEMVDKNGAIISTANPNEIVIIRSFKNYPPNSLIRKT